MKIKLLAMLSTLALLAPGTYAQQQPDMSALMGAMGAMFGGAANQTGTVEVVNFRDLKALLPDSIGSAKRKSAGGEKNSVMGFTISQAEGTYESGSAQTSIKFIDYGGTAIMGLLGAWAMTDVDRETDTSYERTTKIKGFKALEKFDSSSKSGETQILVANRFMVEIEVNDGTEKDMQAAANAIDLKKLSELK